MAPSHQSEGAEKSNRIFDVVLLALDPPGAGVLAFWAWELVSVHAVENSEVITLLSVWWWAAGHPPASTIRDARAEILDYRVLYRKAVARLEPQPLPPRADTYRRHYASVA